MSQMFDSPSGAKFSERFGADQMQKIVAAATEHNNDAHNNTGDDLFAWALSIAIGHECMGRFKTYHGITVDEEEVRQWCLEHDVLASHTGDVDYIALLAGTYNGWVRQS